jgi:ABC-type dipeptide/oligopeptide/nickel transport system permease component
MTDAGRTPTAAAVAIPPALPWLRGAAASVRRHPAAFFIARRFVWSLIVLFVLATITFGLARIVPADPAAFLAGPNASQATIASIRHEYGLDRPLEIQYVSYMAGLLHGNLGISIRTRDPVASDLASYLPATLELLFASFLVYIAASLLLGIASAYRAHGLFGGGVKLLTMAGTGLPVFWVGAVLQLIFFYLLGWLPLGGRLGEVVTPPPPVTGFYTIDSLLAGQWSTFVDSVTHLVLPSAAIVLSLLAVGMRQTQAAVMQELGRHYVRTARGKGMSELRIALKHVLRNALNPILTVTGIQFGYMVSWVILVEVVFNWPGIGLYAYQSFQVFDYAPIIAVTLIATVVFLTVNLLTDIAYALIDPRVRGG